MAKLSPQPTLGDYQTLIRELVLERGFEKETITEVFTLFVEEVGELAKAIRKENGQKVGAHSKLRNIEEEAADIFWLLIDLCNRLDIDLESAFRAKEAVNEQREWK